MNGWKNDKRWSDRFIPEIKSVLAQHLISESPIEEDKDGVIISFTDFLTKLKKTYSHIFWVI
ncbi:MAG: hypothetical protein ABIJ59_12390 [Pseudomonadota bacterium]